MPLRRPEASQETNHPAYPDLRSRSASRVPLPPFALSIPRAPTSVRAELVEAPARGFDEHVLSEVEERSPNVFSANGGHRCRAWEAPNLSMEIPAARGQAGQQRRVVDEAAGDEVADLAPGLALALPDAVDGEQAAGQQGLALRLRHRGPDDDVDVAGLVLERDEDHALGRLGYCAPF